MKNKQKVELLSILKSLNQNEEFNRLLELMPLFNKHTIMQSYMAGDKAYNPDIWTSMLYELDVLDKKGGE